MLIEGILVAGLACSPLKRRTDVNTEALRLYSDHSFISVNSLSQPRVSAMPEPIDIALARDFSSIPQVKHIFVQHSGDELRVWIGLNDLATQEIRFRIYDKELEAMDAFPSTKFDFNVIATMGRPLPELISESGHLAFTRPF